MNLAEIIGVAGFVLAAILGGLEIKRYHLHMAMYVQSQQTEHQNGYTFLFLYTAFVNPSSRGRTVRWIEHIPPDGLVLVHGDFSYGPTKKNVIFFSHKHPEIKSLTYNFDIQDIMSTPLDIPAHKSEARWLPFVIISKDKKRMKSPIVLKLIAKDGSRKRLCECNVELLDSVGE